MDIRHCRQLKHKPAQIGVAVEVTSLERDSRANFQKAPDIAQDAGITEQGLNVAWSPLSHVKATKVKCEAAGQGAATQKAQSARHWLRLTPKSCSKCTWDKGRLHKVQGQASKVQSSAETRGDFLQCSAVRDEAMQACLLAAQSEA